MKEIKLIIKTNTEKYPVIIGSNLIYNLGRIIKKNSIKFNKCLVVFDKNVPKSKISIIKKCCKLANVTVEKKKELFHRSCQLARVLSSAIITTIYNTTIDTTIKLT